MLRRIEPDGALLIAIVHALTTSLGLTIERALEFAERSMDIDRASIDVAIDVTLIVDTGRLRQSIEARLAEAMEVVVQPRRGRPRAPRLVGSKVPPN